VILVLTTRPVAVRQAVLAVIRLGVGATVLPVVPVRARVLPWRRVGPGGERRAQSRAEDRDRSDHDQCLLPHADPLDGFQQWSHASRSGKRFIERAFS